MVVEAALIIEDAKTDQSNASVLQQLVVLLVEKTQNLELIQATYERDMDVMRQKLNDHESTIKLLSAQVEDLQSRFSSPVKSEQSYLAPSFPEVAGSSSDEPISPGLSSSLQDVFNQLEFLNDKSNKLESISSYSDDKHSSSLHSLHLHEDDLGREVEAEEDVLMKPTPILVTTLSYDTSTYNDSTNQSDYNEEDIEEVYTEEELVSKLESKPPMISLPDEDTAAPTMKSLKKKAVVTQTLVAKIPIVLQETSADEGDIQGEETEVEQAELVKQAEQLEKEMKVQQELENVEADDVFDEESLAKSNEVTKEDATDSTDFRLQYPWTRSDTFDVIPVSQSSQIAVPVKPKRGVVSPLQSQRHPTERDDTMGDIAQIEKAPLQRLPAENTEHFSDHSTFSQVSSNRSSSFDYEVQYIMPQLSEGDPLAKAEEKLEVRSSADKDTPCITMEDEVKEKITDEDGKNFNFDSAEVTVKVSKASNSENEDDVITPQ